MNSFKDFVAGKLRVTVEPKDYPQFAKMCDGAGVRWTTKTKMSDAEMEGHVTRTYYTLGHGEAYFSSRAGMPTCTARFMDITRRIPADPWAEFVAGQCYLRVTKEEWAEFSKRCEAAGIKWQYGVGGVSSYEADFRPDAFVHMNSLRDKNRGIWQRPGLNAPETSEPIHPFVPAPPPDYAKVGDTIRVKMDGAEGSNVNRGDTFKVVGARDDGNITTDGHGWFFAPQSYEIVKEPVKPAPPIQEPYDGRGKHKVGDRFEVLPYGFPNEYCAVGDIVELARDDKSCCPYFRKTGCAVEFDVLWARLRPVTPVFPRIEITTDGRVTTATLYEDGKAVKTGTATCGPDDVFEFTAGARLAFNRLIPVNIRELRVRLDMDTSAFDAALQSVVDALGDLPNRVKVEKA